MNENDPYFVAMISNKFIKSAENTGKIPKELNLECLIINRGSYVDCNYSFKNDIYDKNNNLIDLNYIKSIFSDKFIMNKIN
jgi:hypothetical protein